MTDIQSLVSKITSLFSFPVLFALLPNTALAQIIPDSSLGAESSVVESNDNRDTIKGGAIRDANLFHSFQEFNVEALKEAYFNNPDGIANIFSRVTGNNISDIQGVLGVLGNANLYLINPNGILFGENASLDVNGSFFATSADSVLFDNGFEFSAANPDAPPLLTIDIPIGLRFRDNPGDILNQSNTNGVGLAVNQGETIALIGGNVRVENGGIIFAPEGRIELGGLTETGTIAIAENNSFSFPDCQQ
ncbi:MAG: filamentous hemagglutinin N-terminal domain-containing protein [Xenococcaceae cyanobacterium MO_188.B29]|nr:filamentous hemagglutinin N-terminal domain-containing protein [Xenococcaceae cyanobacterium MO_188.B29]